MGQQVSRVKRLEAVVGEEPPGEPPELVIYWPEDETPETRAEQARVKAWYRKYGWPIGGTLVVDWGDDDSE